MISSPKVMPKLMLRGKILLVLLAFVFYCYFLILQNRNILFGLPFLNPSIEETRKCLSLKLKSVNEENFAFEWLKLDELVNVSFYIF